jgi:signal transduction histidine kinase
MFAQGKQKTLRIGAGIVPVPKVGLEPTRAQCSLSPEPSASANSATSAYSLHNRSEQNFTWNFRFVNLEEHAIISMNIMAPITEQLSLLLSPPAGNMIYSLIFGFIIFSAFLASVYAKGKQKSSVGNRQQFGLVLLLLVQMVLFGAALMAWMVSIDGHFYLPPLDRVLAVFSLVLIIWLWAFPKPDLFADVIFALVEIIIVGVGITGMYLWLRLGVNISFNTSILGGYAYYLGLGLLALGVILLLVRRPSFWGFGILMLLIILCGYIGQYFLSQANEDYSWLVHLGELVGSLFLLALPLRLVGLGQVVQLAEKYKVSQIGSSGGSASLFQSVMKLLSETSPQEYYQELTQVVADIMNADYCMLMMQPKSGEQLIIPVGYNRIQEQMLDGFATAADKIPSILEAIKNGKTLRSAGSKLDSEVQTLAYDLGMSEASQLLIVPFQLQGISAVLSLGVLSRTSEVIWTDEDTNELMGIAVILVSKAGQYSKGASQQADREEMTQKLKHAEAYADQVRLEYAQLKAKYDSISAQVPSSAAEAGSLAELVESQKKLQDTVNRLGSRNRELESLLARGRPSMEEVEQLRQELRSALTDLARIPSTLSKSDQRMLETQLSAVKRLDDMRPTELVTSIAQEFRQPLSSIKGYTDLLLGESVGLLGAMQKKFLEQVKASTEKLGILLDELVQVMSIDGGKVDQTLVSVDLKTVIDEAVGNISAQISEKNITMQVDLPDKLPTIHIYKDALQQILANLLENACLITPVNGIISLMANLEQKDTTPSFILISVTDQGGGVAKGDLPRVFLRRYKMENPNIPGIGDTGVGLSIVKSLVELYKGRVWVDSTEGVGSTFSVLLPLADDQSSEITPADYTG